MAKKKIREVKQENVDANVVETPPVVSSVYKPLPRFRGCPGC